MFMHYRRKSSPQIPLALQLVAIPNPPFGSKFPPLQREAAQGGFLLELDVPLLDQAELFIAREGSAFSLERWITTRHFLREVSTWDGIPLSL